MWNDEDNNPYGAFDQHEARLSDSLHSAALSARELPSLHSFKAAGIALSPLHILTLTSNL